MAALIGRHRWAPRQITGASFFPVCLSSHTRIRSDSWSAS